MEDAGDVPNPDDVESASEISDELDKISNSSSNKSRIFWKKINLKTINKKAKKNLQC